MILLTKALSVDPTYARANALLAWCHSQEVVYLWSADRQRDREAARRAIDAAAGSIGDDPMAMTASALHSVNASRSTIEPRRTSRAPWLSIRTTHGHGPAMDGSPCSSTNLKWPSSASSARRRSVRSIPSRTTLNWELPSRSGTPASTQEQRDRSSQSWTSIPKSLGLIGSWLRTQALAGDLASARRAVELLLAAHPNVSVAVMNTHHPGRHLPRLWAAAGRVAVGWPAGELEAWFLALWPSQLCKLSP